MYMLLLLKKLPYNDSRIYCTYPLPTHALHVECNLPDPNTHIRTSTSQPPRLLPTSIFEPEYSIDPTHTGIFDTDVPPDILDAPDVYVCIERAGSTVPVVGGPREGIDSGGMMGPAVCDRLRE